MTAVHEPTAKALKAAGWNVEAHQSVLFMRSAIRAVVYPDGSWLVLKGETTVASGREMTMATAAIEARDKAEAIRGPSTREMDIIVRGQP